MGLVMERTQTTEPMYMLVSPPGVLSGSQQNVKYMKMRSCYSITGPHIGVIVCSRVAKGVVEKKGSTGVPTVSKRGYS